MIAVLQTHSVSWAETARLTLLGAGIEAVILDQYSPGTLGLAGSVRVAIANDADLERAKKIISELRRRPRNEVSSSWRWHKWALAAFGLAFVVGFGGASMSESANLTLTFSSAGAILFASAFVFLLLGHRADKQAKARENARAAQEPNEEAP